MLTTFGRCLPYTTPVFQNASFEHRDSGIGLQGLGKAQRGRSRTTVRSISFRTGSSSVDYISCHKRQRLVKCQAKLRRYQSAKLVKLKHASKKQWSILEGSVCFNLFALVPTINALAILSEQLGLSDLPREFKYPAIVLFPILNLAKDACAYALQFATTA
ncbi:hypothetical protein ABBQ38_014058 [Trebouxia sp. C0009 RCD-2024]